MDDEESTSQMQDPITELLTSYDELNFPEVEELDEVPSALEFMRYVHKNRPFVVRGGAADWEATRTWNVKRLKELVGDESVNVAVTPEGNADSPTIDTNGELVFVKPWEEQQPFSEFLDYITTQELSTRNGPTTTTIKEGKREEEVRYAQTQNDNLRNEYSMLFKHVESSISWARIALQSVPEAINLWIGNSRSVTALHKDNYENVYCQILGEKRFLLLPPVAFPCVGERRLRAATYYRGGGVVGGKEGLEIRMDDVVDGDDGDGGMVPFATWDPDRPEVNKTKYSGLARPMRVTLQKGDMLYLPALWYHKVSQTCSEEGLCVAVNYW